MTYQPPPNIDPQQVRRRVRNTYRRVAEQPSGNFHFHRGMSYARDYLGYDPIELRGVSSLATERFAGVGNPLLDAPIKPGDVVLDHACGAGTDLLLAAKRVGPTGHAIGVDMTSAMCSVAQAAARASGLNNVSIISGYMEELPLENNSVDCAISNGVINLSPQKQRVFAELARVLKPGGVLVISDVIVRREIKLEVRQNAELWASCIGGALTPMQFEALALENGFLEPRLTRRFDCFRNTSAGAKVSKDLEACGMNLVAQRAPRDSAALSRSSTSADGHQTPEPVR